MRLRQDIVAGCGIRRPSARLRRSGFGAMMGDHTFNRRAAARGIAMRRSKLLLIGSLEAVKRCARSLRVDPRAPSILGGALLTDARTAAAEWPDRLGRMPVFGALDALETVLATQFGRPFDAIVVCDTLEPRAVRRRLVERAALLGLSMFRADYSGAFTDLRPYSSDDLIGPGALTPNREWLHRLINGRRVLVTGAGGSIGSQLCLRIAALSPAKLTLLDSSEYNLFTIHHQLQADYPRLPLMHALCDVRDRIAVERWFESELPQIVFHAAALKQLPMVQCHPSEGVLTNVLGTRVVAQAAVAAGAHMLLVSTDKAVDPTAVMGASKRLAELYCQALDADLAKSNGPRVMSARLGNVLGSAGSVVQIFDRQIQAGGPVTVTDPDAMRYFITIPQAADFLLSAAADSLSVGAMRGAVHVMEMGEPLLIADLARDMIRLAGQRPDVDIKVSFMGLRPGEKVSERLIAADERVVERRTASGIFLVKASPRSLRVLDNALDQLIESARQRRDDDVRRSLMALASPPDAAADGAAKAG